MRRIFPTFCVIFILTLASACAMRKNNKPMSMQVIRDCTGTYLRIDQKDHHVCNVNALDAYKDGQMVNVEFEKTADCGEQPEMVCMMFHENEGWIKVLKINE